MRRTRKTSSGGPPPPAPAALGDGHIGAWKQGQISIFAPFAQRIYLVQAEGRCFLDGNPALLEGLRGALKQGATLEYFYPDMPTLRSACESLRGHLGGSSLWDGWPVDRLCLRPIERGHSLFNLCLPFGVTNRPGPIFFLELGEEGKLQFAAEALIILGIPARNYVRREHGFLHEPDHDATILIELSRCESEYLWETWKDILQALAGKTK